MARKPSRKPPQRKKPPKAQSAGAKRARSAARKQKSDDELMTKLKRFVRARAPAFLDDPNITSVGIGYKQTAGKATAQLAIQFSVESKVMPQDVQGIGSRPIPATMDVDGTVIPTDVIERSYKPSFKTIPVKPTDDRKARAEIVRPGMSIGNARLAGAGTIGTFVRDRSTQQVVLLSNWHVLQGAAGAIGDDIVQPGRFDDNRAERNFLGKLLRSHLGPAGDCAIASLSGRGFSNDIVELGVAISAIGEPQLGDRVVKSGRTTAVTYGVVTRIEVNTKMTYQGGVSEVVGGFEIGPDPQRPPPDNEISRGGDSGSTWLAVGKNGKPTQVMLGLHFAGDADDGGTAEFALACYANSVITKLEVDPIGQAAATQAAAEDVEDLRGGFDQDFLSFHVGLPKFRKSLTADLAELDGEKQIRYCHFSVWLSKARRYPACVAWNIDGSRFKRLNRLNFRVDRRGDLEDYQLDNDIYVNNVLDRGHIARRADLCWGTLAEARQGNYDSFYYSNIAPQHEAFNQSNNVSFDPEGGVWGRLENTIFDSEAPHDLRVSVLGGPVFSSKDRKFVQNGEECFLPREYWKVVAYVDDDDNKEKVFGFLLTQASLVDGLFVPEGLDFDQWLWARITLQDLQEKSRVVFPKSLKDREVPFVAPQALGAAMSVKPLFSSADYFAS